MIDTRFEFPDATGPRGPRYWLNPAVLLSVRKKFRRDRTTEWRRRWEEQWPVAPDRSVDYSVLVDRPLASGFSFLILGDTGEGDKSQFGLLPLIRALAPDFIIINGDLAYPAGRAEDFYEGFFAPYRDLGVPIWAVPGNHEYYSRHSGREFYELFCTENERARWVENGLHLVPQPGTFWELGAEECPLVVLGVDTGMSGFLDPGRYMMGLLKTEGDPAQLAWLRDRLELAEARGKKVLLLFHIPSLVNLEKSTKTKLDGLYALIGRFSATISAVVTAHEHSFQYYTPEEFSRFIAADGPNAPHYFISGSGGAFLSAVDYDRAEKPDQFQAAYVFPDMTQWQKYSGPVRKMLSFTGLANSGLARGLSSLTTALADVDATRYQSLLQVTVRPDSSGSMTSEMTAFFQTSLEDLYYDQPETRVSVRDGRPAPTSKGLERIALRDHRRADSGLRVRLAP